jgi:hypothetical protein
MRGCLREHRTASRRANLRSRAPADLVVFRSAHRAMLIAKLQIATTIGAKSAAAAPNFGPPKTCGPHHPTRPGRLLSRTRRARLIDYDVLRISVWPWTDLTRERRAPAPNGVVRHRLLVSRANQCQRNLLRSCSVFGWDWQLSACSGIRSPV